MDLPSLHRAADPAQNRTKTRKMGAHKVLIWEDVIFFSSQSYHTNAHS